MSSKKVKVSIITSLIKFFGIFSGKCSLSVDGIEPPKVKNIAIFSTTALGDFMFNTPAIISVRDKFPQANITLVSSYKNKGFVGDSPWFHNVIYWDQKVKNIFSVVSALRKNKPDLVLLLHSKSPYDVLFAKLSGAVWTLKDAYNDVDAQMRGCVSAMSEINFPGHLIERKMHLIGLLGCNTSDIRMQIPYKVSIPNKDDLTIKVGFQLGASEALRQWPIKRFQELARLLISARRNYQIVLIGSPKETQLADDFLAGLTDADKNFVANTIGSLSLQGLVETISGFDFLVTGDTGPLHLAVALRVKTISLFVTANPKHTGPLQDPELHTIICAPYDEPASETQPMGMISATEVMDAIVTYKQRCSLSARLCPVIT